jgi:hypothetical protein
LRRRHVNTSIEQLWSGLLSCVNVSETKRLFHWPLEFEIFSRNLMKKLHHRRSLGGSVAGGMVFLLSVVGSGCNRQPEAGPASPASPALAPADLTPLSLTNMVFIKAGSFVRIKQPVTLTRDYWIAKYEVTQGEYANLIGVNPSHFKGDPNRPVEKVSFLDAVSYCDALTKRERENRRLPMGYHYRLPSEAEWEFACRAGTTNRFSFGDGTNEADQYAWTLENSDSMTHPVGQKHPNPWGLFDMHGNVWEWCNDWFEQYPEQPQTDPVGPSTSKFKVFRGGGWNNTVDYARSSNRFMMSPTNGIHFVGFRVALSLEFPAENRR